MAVTVEELIKELSKHNPKAVVIRDDADGECVVTEVVFASDWSRGNAEVWGVPAIVIR